MRAGRLSAAFADPPAGRWVMLGAGAEDDLGGFAPARTTIVQRDFADHQSLAARGFAMLADAADLCADGGPHDGAVVFLPRAKAAARAAIHAANAALAPGRPLWIDGQKTDGVDAILREIRALTPPEDVMSKAHGKLFRVDAGPWVPADWAAQGSQIAPGFGTRPGVFSADGIDPGSALLAAHLPDRLPTRIVDLGAGWGWLAAQALTRAGVEVIHLVEADHQALASARDNITDPRARFHWADARDFRLPDPVNGVIMNPPFHSGRTADPGLGRAFIATAARLLTGAGRLWMVANRHLPYEAALTDHFAQVTEIGGDARYKIIEASGAGRGSPARQARSKRR